jgi:hypothetical protein
LRYGASRNVEDEEKRTPFSLALKLEKIHLMDILLSPEVSVASNPSLLFDFQTHIFNTEYTQILSKIL